VTRKNGTVEIKKKRQRRNRVRSPSDITGLSLRGVQKQVLTEKRVGTGHKSGEEGRVTQGAKRGGTYVVRKRKKGR